MNCRVLAGLALAAALPVVGCKAKVGELRTVDVTGDAQGDPSHPVDVHIAIKGGELHLTPGGAHVVGGAVRSNVAELDPTVDAAGGHVFVTQGRDDAQPGKYGSDLVADWRLTIGTAPIGMTVDAGAAKVDLDLSGLALKSLAVKTGAGGVSARWNAANPIKADAFTVESGVGDVTLTDVGRLGASKIRVHSGAGTVTLALGATVDRDVVLDLENGAGAIFVKVPSTVTARADVQKGVGAVTANGWSKEGDTYLLGATGAPPRVNITAHSGAGAITLEASP